MSDKLNWKEIYALRFDISDRMALLKSRIEYLEEKIDSVNCETQSIYGKSFLTHYVPSGTSCGENLECAKKLSVLHNKRCIFIFNYCDIFEVYPDGTWICERIRGGSPMYGKNSKSWVK